jgi:uncharacterized protein YeaO (DUF488 family)
MILCYHRPDPSKEAAMLFRAPVALVKSGMISKREAHLVVAMRHYPRYTPKALIDEYARELAPEAELFKEFKEKDRELKDHNAAFDHVDYERRFSLGDDGLATLERLSTQARSKDVYLLCQCTHEEKCHCDLLLLTARARFGALVSQIPFHYPTYAAKLTAEPGA